MKFCNKRRLEYKGINNTVATTIYVTDEDIKSFHGEQFFKQFLVFVNVIKKFKEKEIEGYYYPDYQFIARRTELFLNPIS